MGASLIGCENPTGPDSPVHPLPGGKPGRQRVAILGGGAGGLAAAYFLGPVHEVEIFESRGKVGGHCDSQAVEYQGRKINVDLGAQFFHPETHPLYVTLLEELGLYNPDHAGADETVEAPGSLCVLPKAGNPIFNSNHPLLTPFFAVDFALYAQHARNVVLQNQSWEMRLDEWIGKLPVSGRFKNEMLFPWISALIGTTLADAKRSSARSILQTFALAFPANIFEGASTYNSRLGLGGNLDRMLEATPVAQLHVNAAATGLAFADGKWTVRTASGSHGPFAHVVINAPPRIGRGLLQPLPWASDIAALLDKYESFDARMLIHTDAKYVHKDRKFWAAYNGQVDGGVCEGSVWYGAIHEKLASGGTLDVFKSWAQHRAADPANILLERRFRHPLITPESIRAARSLRGHQGRNGLYFSGQYTTGMDMQEAAVFSAMRVAEAVAPASPSLASLRARLEKRGRSRISYDL